MLVVALVSVIYHTVRVESVILNSRCRWSEKIASKVSIASCIASCLELDSKWNSCSYNSTSGKPQERYNNIQKNGCPKCNLPLKNFKSYNALFKMAAQISHPICGKILDFTHITSSSNYEMSSMICGMVWPDTKHWLPKSYDEVRCVIEALPPEVRVVGKLRLPVYKSNCSKEFFLCTVDTPRSIKKSFLNEELNGNTTIFQNTTACALFEFKNDPKKAPDFRLKITDCNEAAFTLCEKDV
ncbi:Hypothetical predicted protein [Cloeon dipterum]|uniref:Uncharacterized protein n=1 Tax=Cloeon dipterum TaxID=197152 RepID=A0A8S1DLH5_9INSE|nr:Hypothetical predicted protein [Cloeon dipterum]